MSPYWRYGLIWYLFPILWFVFGELRAVFLNDPNMPTFTVIITDHVNYSVLFAATAGLGIWLLVHWKETRDFILSQERRAARRARRAARKQH